MSEARSDDTIVQPMRVPFIICIQSINKDTRTPEVIGTISGYGEVCDGEIIGYISNDDAELEIPPEITMSIQSVTLAFEVDMEKLKELRAS
jgi:hypothetical protein